MSRRERQTKSLGCCPSHDSVLPAPCSRPRSDRVAAKMASSNKRILMPVPSQNGNKKSLAPAPVSSGAAPIKTITRTLPCKEGNVQDKDSPPPASKGGSHVEAAAATATATATATAMATRAAEGEGFHQEKRFNDKLRRAVQKENKKMRRELWRQQQQQQRRRWTRYGMPSPSPPPPPPAPYVQMPPPPAPYVQMPPPPAPYVQMPPAPYVQMPPPPAPYVQMPPPPAPYVQMPFVMPYCQPNVYPIYYQR